MKRKTIAYICYAVSLVLLLCFVVRMIIDGVWYMENGVTSSAPFYAYALVNALYFLLPGGIIFVLGWIIKGKNKK